MDLGRRVTLPLNGGLQGSHHVALGDGGHEILDPVEVLLGIGGEVLGPEDCCQVWERPVPLDSLDIKLLPDALQSKRKTIKLCEIRTICNKCQRN